MSAIRKGTVKYFTGSYGIIVPDDGGQEVFCPKQAIILFEIGMLYPEDRVVFKSTPSPTEPGKDVIRWMAMDDGSDNQHQAKVIPVRGGGLR